MPITLSIAESETPQAVWRFGRPGNAVLAAIGVLVGGWAAGAGHDVLLGFGAPSDTGAPSNFAAGLAGILRGLLPVPLVWAFVSAFLGTWGGNMLNDLHDRDLDRRAHPLRPLPSGRLSLNLALGWFLAAWVGSLIAAALVSVWLVLFVCSLMGLLATYELVWKRWGLPGNLAVAAAAGALFPFGAVAVGGPFAAALILGAVAALAHLGRELLKDAEDAEADALERQTFAVRYGASRAALLGSVMLVCAVLASPVPHWLVGWSNLYLLAVLPALALFLAAAARGRRDAAQARALAKLAMVLALLAFALGAWTAP